MTASSAAHNHFGDDDFVAGQRAGLHAPRTAYREQAVPEATQCVSCGSGTALRRR